MPLYFLARKITRCVSHISRPMPFGWSMCDIGGCISWPEKSQDAYRTALPIRFGWSAGPQLGRCAILGFVFLGHKITRCVSHSSTDAVRLVDVRYWVLYFLARKITRGVSHISRLMPFGWSMCDIRLCISWPEKSQDAYRTARPIRLVDVRYWVLHFLARKITRCVSHISRPIPFGWSMCDIGFCIYWPEKSQDANRTALPIRFGWSMCEFGFFISWP